MKKVYFVRHGESEGNAGNIRSSHETPLTQKGKDQAMFIAERLQKLPLQTLIVSTMTRARETAGIIAQRNPLPVEYSDLFVEARTASSVQDKPRSSEEGLAYSRAYFENFGKEGWKYLDEENFFDLKERARQALELLEQRPEEHVGVVTHGFFMRIMMAYVVFGDTLTAQDCLRFTRIFHMENTGLTVFGYSAPPESALPPQWWLWVWNDHAHLG